MMCVAKSLLRICTAALLCGAASVAHGQDATDALRLETEDEVVVDEQIIEQPQRRASPRITIGDDAAEQPRRRRRTVDAFAAQGLPAGAFRLYPSLEIGSVISSNARLATANPKPDLGLRLKPSLRLESNWSRHSLTGTASFEGQKFLENDDLKSISGSAQGALRLDVRRTTRSDIEWNYSATSTGIGNSQIPATATGARLDHSIGAAAGVSHDFGGLEGRLRLGATRNLYGDVDLVGGGKEDNADRAYTQVSLSARANLRTGGMVQPFGEVAYEPRFYDKKQDRNGLERSSHGMRLSAGVTLAGDPLWAGDVAATLEMRDYSDDSLKTALAPGVAANLTWRPTDLTRFEFNAGASLSETVAAGVSATKNWTWGAKLSHALRENVEITAGLRGVLERVEGESSITTIGSFGVNWTVNPTLVLGAGYEGTFLNSPVPNGDYSDHRLLTSIILRR